MTAHPTGAWAVQQARNLTMDLGDRLGTLKFLIHDRDPLFTAAFAEVFKSEGLRVITTLPRTPRMNAICERVVGTLRRELLDRVLILGERHLVLVLREYVIHYDRHRPHQSRQQRPVGAENLCHLAGCSAGHWLLARAACQGVGRSSACGVEADLLDCHPCRVAAGAVAAGGAVEGG